MCRKGLSLLMFLVLVGTYCFGVTHMEYSTYLGGSTTDAGSLVAVDSVGDIYITGYTNSMDLPVSVGAYSSSTTGGTDMFVAKLYSSGTALAFCTYIGGNGEDFPSGLAFDSFGNVYIAGRTSSTNFPTTVGAYTTALAGGTDGFITKINATGTGLLYSTYLGGNVFDQINGLAVDADGNAYVVGYTASSNFPVMSSSYKPVSGGGQDGFITKINTTGTALLYSTYMGGSGTDFITAVAINTSGNVFVTGYTDSSNFPTTLGAYSTVKVGNNDIFITKLNHEGTALVYSTLLGGTGNDKAVTIDVDDLENAYVAGYTASSDFPITAGAYATHLMGGLDFIVAKMNSTGSALEYSTYLGGKGNDVVCSIAVDSNRNAFITGYTYSSNFPMINSYQTLAGSADAFLTKISSSGNLIFSTLVGGSGADISSGLALDLEGNAYITGYTYSTNYPTTAGAYSLSNKGGANITADAFITKFGNSTIVPVELSEFMITE